MDKKEIFDLVKTEFEELDEKSPEEIEKEILEHEAQVPKDPMEGAAAMYGMYLPKFKQGVGKLSSRQLRRLINALMEYPIEERKYKHTSQIEKELMAIGHAVLEAKFIMLMSAYSNHLELLNRAARGELTKEEVKEFGLDEKLIKKEEVDESDISKED